MGRSVRHVVVLGSCLSLAACSLTDIVGQPASDPEQTSTDVVKSAEGAMLFARGVSIATANAVGYYVTESGRLTDELRGRFYRQLASEADPLDVRLNHDTDLNGQAYGGLQTVRANARQGRGLLGEYAPAALPASTGELYALEGMADVLLADFYCSGIPLSTVNYDGTITFAAGSSTAAVYRTAITLFDSALVLSTDSARIHDFAAVGKARALLALGEYAQAAAAVHDVPTAFTYQTSGGRVLAQGDSLYGTRYGVSDREGVTGLPYVSSGDPRTTVDTVPNDPIVTPLLLPVYVAKKYSPDGLTPVVVASGTEARLIEAEADVRTGGTQWLDILNQLRASAGLAALQDPTLGTIPPGNTPTSVRLGLVLDERGYWLFLTGHRQGDLRRIVRNDHRPQQSVYPSGLYPSGGTYGADVNIPIPINEQQANHNYTGCLDREA